MARAMVNFRIDEKLKRDMENVCKEMGLSMSTAFTIFAAKVSKERRIPFDIEADPDPFYSDANMTRLRQAVADANEDRNMAEHDLIEIGDD